MKDSNRATILWLLAYFMGVASAFILEYWFSALSAVILIIASIISGAVFSLIYSRVILK